MKLTLSKTRWGMLALLSILPVVAFAQENAKFVPLVGIPGVDENAQSFDQYVSALFVLSIGVASALAVIRIIGAGVKYMTTDIVPAKGEAKKEIIAALLGLLLILGSVTILNEINPNLTTFKIFQNAQTLNVTVERRPNVTTGVTSCPEGEELRVATKGTTREGYCVSTGTGRGEILYQGRLSQSRFGSFEEFETWCTSQDGSASIDSDAFMVCVKN